MRQAVQSTIPFFHTLFSTFDRSFQSTRNFNRTDFASKIKNFKFNKKHTPKIVLGLFAVVIITAVIFVFTNTNKSTVASDTEKPAAPVALKTENINREFSFPITNDAGKEISKMKYEIQKASIQNEILVKGQRARAVEGRVFLILDIKISNSFDQGLQINSRDYVRLVVNGNKNELIAADIHNDPVEAQAISTKTTRIGFPINETDHDLELQVGEISGKKETIKLSVNN